ncbi:MAG: hypothetical protein NTY86_10180 [Deltaproteobacteria bacterium]|nr:hypothetical protein [Deltaproteobacteria bacterium]
MAKEWKNRVMHSGSVLLAVIGLLMLAEECRAFPYRPAAAVSILSEYAASKDSAPPHTQVWKVVPEVGPDGASILRFFLEASAEAVPVCELRLPSPGAAGEIRWEGMGETGQKRSGAGILFLPGFPAPCDVLPVGQGDRERAYGERIEAGGRVFSKSYRVSFAAFSVADAKATGWIRTEEPVKAGLIMVTVTDEKGRPVVKQLWPADGTWWLYEETPLRRSWLIY